jgi:hypothetical protein
MTLLTVALGGDERLGGRESGGGRNAGVQERPRRQRFSFRK